MTDEGPHLVFETSSGRYAVPAERVRQVVWLPRLATATDRGGAEIGTAQLGEDEVAIVDPDLAVGRDPDPYSLDHRLLDLSTEEGRLGVVVRDVVDVTEIDDEALVPSDPVRPVEASALVEGARTELLDVDRLRDADPRIEVAAEELFASFTDEELAELARRQREVPAETAAPSPPRRSAVVVHLAREPIALPLDDVVALVQLPELTPVPHAPDHVLGLMNHRGQAVTIVDAHGPLGLEAPRSWQPRLAAIVELPEGPAGIAIEAAGRIRPLDVDAVSEERPGVLGEIEHDGEAVTLVDPFALLRSDRVVVDQGGRA